MTFSKFAHKQDNPSGLDFKEELTIMGQELQSNMENSMKAMFTQSFNLISNKQPQTCMMASGVIDQSVQQALKNNREINLINNQIGKKLSLR